MLRVTHNAPRTTFLSEIYVFSFVGILEELVRLFSAGDAVAHGDDGIGFGKTHQLIQRCFKGVRAVNAMYRGRQAASDAARPDSQAVCDVPQTFGRMFYRRAACGAIGYGRPGERLFVHP